MANRVVKIIVPRQIDGGATANYILVSDTVGSGSKWVSQISESQVTNLTTDLAAKVAKAGDTMTGSLRILLDGTSPYLTPASSDVGLYLSGRTTVQAAIHLASYGVNNVGYFCYNAEGSSDSPSATSSGRIVGQFRAMGWDGVGTAWQNGGRLRWSAQENWSAGAHGCVPVLEGVLSGTASLVTLIDFSATSGYAQMPYGATVGTDPGGSEKLRVGGDIRTNGRNNRIGGASGLNTGWSANDYADIGYNTTRDATATQTYAANDLVRRIYFGSTLKFQYAATGTAGNAITWTDQMSIDSSGKVGINCTPSNRLHAYSPTAAYFKIMADGSSAQFGNDGAGPVICTSNVLKFFYGCGNDNDGTAPTGTKAGEITAAGDWILGTSDIGGSEKLRVVGGIRTNSSIVTSTTVFANALNLTDSNANADVYINTAGGKTGDPSIQLRTDGRYDAIVNTSSGLELRYNYSGTLTRATLRNTDLYCESSMTCTGAINQTGGQYHYMRGDASTNGSVRFSSPSSGVMTIESRISGTWTEIGRFG
jgi:hypothetical protein